MARLKEKNEEITGNLNPKYWVQKCDPLFVMKSVPFTLGELKILDTYLSRINASDDSRRTVIFTKEEYEKLMEISCANTQYLKNAVTSLLSKVVKLEIQDEFLPFVLFEKAHYHKDEFGKPIIELTCTETAKDLFFCIGRYHYLKYALENIINLTHKASYLLYLHIRQFRFRGEWTIPLTELRDNVLDCKSQKSYQGYKEFKRSVLEPAVKEVNEKTDCHFEYEALKRGRSVTDIRFIYKPEEPEQLTLDELSNKADKDTEVDTDAAMIEKYGSERLATLASGVDYEFSKEDMELVSMILTRIELPPDPYDHSGLWARVRYLREKYTALNAEAAKKKQNGGRIGNRFAYFKGILEKDTYVPATYK